jgi:Fic family protein
MAKYIWQTRNWHSFTYDHTALIGPLAKARGAQGILLGRVSALDIGLETDAQAAVLTEEAVRTAEIEGIALNREAVRSSVAQRLGLPQGVGIKKDRNADGLIAVLLDAVRLHDKPLSLKRLNGWQAALFPTGYSGLSKIRTGALRGDEPMRVISGPISRVRIHFEAPPRETLDQEMRQFIDWWNASPGAADGILRAAAAHLRFVTIHPYEDGNGRIARALTDMALAQDEKSTVRFYSMSSRIMKDRNDYYRVLESVQNCRVDATQWFEWFLKTFVRSVEDSRGIIAHVFARASFWKEHTQTSINDRQRKVVQKLLEAGPDGFAGGLTTRKYAGMTGASRATAFREIDDLREKGMLRYSGGKGRSVHYELQWNNTVKFL